jgi:hypothetical protein
MEHELPPALRDYFYSLAKWILREIMNSRGSFHLFKASESSRSRDLPCMSFYDVQEKIDENAYHLPDEFIADVRAVFRDAGHRRGTDEAMAYAIEELSVRFEQLAARLPHFLTAQERNSGLSRLVELQKYRYLLQKPTHQ